MTDFYEKDFIEKIKVFDRLLDENIYEKLNKIENPQEQLHELMYFFPQLQVAVKVLFVIIENEMWQTNKMRQIISKLPNEEKYQELKSIFEERDNEIEKTIKPLSDYAKELEESKKRKPDYIE